MHILDNNSDENRIAVKHLGLFAYIVYICWIVAIEWVNFIPQIIADYNLEKGIAEVVASLILIVVFFAIHKIIRFKKINIDLELIIGVSMILIAGFLFSVYPDKAYDTMNYHLIAQNPEFENYFTEDYGYGSFQVWGFRLCDRMFYYFRMLLGYRLGTTLNIFALALSFVQVYEITGKISGNEQNANCSALEKILCNRLIWSLAIVLPLDAIMMMGCYYVDVVMMPVGIRTIREVIETCDSKVNKTQIYTFAFLCGLWIGGKLTNIVFVIPCVLTYVILHFERIHLKEWLASVCLGVIPYADYMTWNYKCTRNPFFPYYNTIFKSENWTLTNFKDMRWGGETLQEKLLWVLYAVAKPEYRQGEIYDRRTELLAIGVCSLAVLFFYVILNGIKHKKIDKKLASITVIAVLSSLLWGFTTGYSRYFITGRIVFGIIAYGVISTVSRKKGRISLIFKFTGHLLTTIVLISLCMNLKYSWEQGGWGWANRNLNSLKEQLQCILTDRDNTIDDDADLCVLTYNEAQGIAELTSPDAYSFFTVYMDYIGQNKEDELEILLEEYTIGYDFHTRAFNDIESYIETLNGYNLYIYDMDCETISIGNYEIISLNYNEEEKNTIWTSKQGPVKINVSGINNTGRISFLAGFAYDWSSSSVMLVFKSDDDVLGSTIIDSKNIERYEMTIDITDETEEITVEARYVDNGEMVGTDDINFAFVANIKAMEK